MTESTNTTIPGCVIPDLLCDLNARKAPLPSFATDEFLDACFVKFRYVKLLDNKEIIAQFFGIEPADNPFLDRDGARGFWRKVLALPLGPAIVCVVGAFHNNPFTFLAISPSDEACPDQFANRDIVRERHLDALRGAYFATMIGQSDPDEFASNFPDDVTPDDLATIKSTLEAIAELMPITHLCDYLGRLIGLYTPMNYTALTTETLDLDGILSVANIRKILGNDLAGAAQLVRAKPYALMTETGVRPSREPDDAILIYQALHKPLFAAWLFHQISDGNELGWLCRRVIDCLNLEDQTDNDNEIDDVLDILVEIASDNFIDDGESDEPSLEKSIVALFALSLRGEAQAQILDAVDDRDYQNGFEDIIGLIPMKPTVHIRSVSIGDWPETLGVAPGLRPSPDTMEYGHPLTPLSFSRARLTANLPPQIHEGQQPLLPFPDDFFSDAEIAEIFCTERMTAALDAAPVIFEIISGLPVPAAEADDATRYAFWREAIKRPSFYPAIAVVSALMTVPGSNSWRHGLAAQNIFKFPDRAKTLFQYLFSGYKKPVNPLKNIPPAPQEDLELDAQQTAIAASWNPRAAPIKPEDLLTLLLFCVGAFNITTVNALRKKQTPPPASITPSMIAVACAYGKRDWHYINVGGAELCRLTGIAPFLLESSLDFGEFYHAGLKIPLFVHAFNKLWTSAKIGPPLDFNAIIEPDTRDSAPARNITAAFTKLMGSKTPPPEYFGANYEHSDAFHYFILLLHRPETLRFGEPSASAERYYEQFADYIEDQPCYEIGDLIRLTGHDWKKYFADNVHSSDLDRVTPPVDSVLAKIKNSMVMLPSIAPVDEDLAPAPPTQYPIPRHLMWLRRKRYLAPHHLFPDQMITDFDDKLAPILPMLRENADILALLTGLEPPGDDLEDRKRFWRDGMHKPLFYAAIIAATAIKDGVFNSEGEMRINAAVTLSRSSFNSLRIPDTEPNQFTADLARLWYMFDKDDPRYIAFQIVNCHSSDLRDSLPLIHERLGVDFTARSYANLALKLTGRLEQALWDKTHESYLTLPEEITPALIATFLSSDKKFIKKIHKHRVRLTRASKIAWPINPPTHAEFGELFIKALQTPLLLNELSDICLEEFNQSLRQTIFPAIGFSIASTHAAGKTQPALKTAIRESLASPNENLRSAAILASCVFKAGDDAGSVVDILDAALAQHRVLFDYLTTVNSIKPSVLRQLTIGNWQKHFGQLIIDHHSNEPLADPSNKNIISEAQPMTVHVIPGDSAPATTKDDDFHQNASSFVDAFTQFNDQITTLASAIAAYRTGANYNTLTAPLTAAHQLMLAVIALEPQQPLKILLEAAGLDPAEVANRLQKAAKTAKAVHAAPPDTLAAEFWTVIAALAEKNETLIAPIHQNTVSFLIAEILRAADLAEANAKTLLSLFQAAFAEGDIDYAMTIHNHPAAASAFTAMHEASEASQKIHDIATATTEITAPAPEKPSAQAPFIVDFVKDVILGAQPPSIAPPTQPYIMDGRLDANVAEEELEIEIIPVTTLESRANKLIRALILEQKFGVARLVAASLSESGETPLMPAELFELAAAAPAHCPAANQNRAYDLTMALEPALANVEGQDLATRTAAGLLLIGSLIGTAVLDANSLAASLLKPLSIDPVLDGAAFKLRTVIEKLTNFGTTLTPGTIAALNDTANLRTAAIEAAKQAAADARRLRNFDYNFTPHADVVSGVCSREGYIFNFAAAIEQADEAAETAAADFLATFADADKIERWVNQMVHMYSMHPQMIRQPLLGQWINRINQIAANCKIFVEIRKAVANVKRAGQHAGPIRDASEAAVKAMTATLAEIDAYAATAMPMVGAAALFASKRLRDLLAFLATATSTPGTQTQIDAALHVDLLLTPGLTFLREASPQQKGDELLASIEAALDARSYNADLGARIIAIAESGAALPALRAAGYLPLFGLSLAKQNQIMTHLHSLIEKRRAELAAEFAAAARQIEQSERIANSESANRRIERLSERLARVKPTQLPAPVDGIVPVPDEAAFYDFPQAFQEIAEVRDQINQLNEEPRQRLLKRLDAIDNPNPGPAARIRALIAANDFVTAEDYLAMLESGETLPRVAAANVNFRSFYPGFIENLDALPSPTAAVQKAINEGDGIADVVPEDLSRAERTRALEILGKWHALQKPGIQEKSAIADFFTAFGLRTQIITAQKDGFLVDFDLPSDRGFLLPNFGSLAKTHGWKVQIAQKLPQEATLKDFAKCPAAICIVTETLDRAARRRLTELTRVNKLPLLVIDEAAMLYAALQRHAAPTTILEIVQPFAYADPFNDNGGGAVPSEIFVGREAEIASLIDPEGAALLYGGRRLGKTATLRQAQQNVAEMVARGAAKIEMIYLDIRNISVTDDDGRIFTEIAAQLPAVFGRTIVRRHQIFREKIINWLALNPGARIICALDEVDNFVAHDSANDFPQIQTLKALMDETNRRFKIILAGNRDVTRFVRTGNTPLRHLSSNILRIGPFVGASERADAEKLITKPLAALGYEFESRELAWTLLSHGLYYPILAQVLSKRLLAWMRHKPTNYELPITITQADVQAVIADPKTSLEVADKFQSTLTLDSRYGFLANIVALLENPANPEATSTHQIAENAATFWPIAFPADQSLWIVESLLDEMDGLGVIKQSSARIYTLRSNAIRELLGTRSLIEAAIMQFSRAAAPAPLTPSDLHRELKPDASAPATKTHPYSPFSVAQDREIANCKEPVLIITGSAATHIDLAGVAIMQNPQLAHTERLVLAPRKKEALTAQIANYANQTKRATIIISQTAPWDESWVRDALTFANVRDNQTRVIFLASDAQIGKIAASDLIRTNPDVRTIATAPWTQSMIAEAFAKYGVASHLGLDNAILYATGGYPLHAINAMALITSAAETHKTLQQWRSEKETQPSFYASLGWTPDITSMLDTFREWTQDGGEYRYKDLPAMFEGADPITQIDPFLYQAEAMSLILRSEDASGPKWRLNPVFLPYRPD